MHLHEGQGPVWAVQAINELHEDEDFQQDAGQSHILGIVDEIRSNSAAMAKYEKDATVMHVLKKLRRFQVRASPASPCWLTELHGGQLCCSRGARQEDASMIAVL